MRVYIGIGSNLGNRKSNLLKAIEMINNCSCSVLRESPIYETEPWGFDCDLFFLNMVIEADTSLSPQDLLSFLQNIEHDLGRTRKGQGYSSRTIDLDILFYDDLIINEQSLIIPHPLIEQRLFVLRPLFDLRPDLLHPVSKRSIEELLSSCNNNSHIVQYTL